MSLLHKLPENLNKTLIYQRISSGQAILFPWEKTTTPTRNLVRGYADSLGCPEEYILFPLLTLPPLLEHMEGSISTTAGKSLPLFGLMCAQKKDKRKPPHLTF